MTETMFRVLIIEDHAGIRDMLRVLLESQHYRVVEAETAARGIIEARNHRPDLAIVDLGLPDRDGLSVIRDIRSFSPMPILVLSARTMETDKIAALDAGADDYFAKPFSTPELLARVRARAAPKRAPRGPTAAASARRSDGRSDQAQRSRSRRRPAPDAARISRFGRPRAQRRNDRDPSTADPGSVGARPPRRHPRPALLYQDAAAEALTIPDSASVPDHRDGSRLSTDGR